MNRCLTTTLTAVAGWIGIWQADCAAGLLVPLQLNRQVAALNGLGGGSTVIGPPSGLWDFSLSAPSGQITVAASQNSDTTPIGVSFNGVCDIEDRSTSGPVFPSIARSWFTSRFRVDEPTDWNLTAVISSIRFGGAASSQVLLSNSVTSEILAVVTGPQTSAFGTFAPGEYLLTAQLTSESRTGARSGGLALNLALNVPAPVTSILALLGLGHCGRRRRAHLHA